LNSYNHAQASARRWGGTPEDYIKIHEFIDGSKKTFGDVRHRALLHNTWGVWVCQEVFGHTIEIKKSTAGVKLVTVREIAEQHIIEDLGRIPTVSDWLENMDIVGWMSGAQHKFVGREDLFHSVILDKGGRSV